MCVRLCGCVSDYSFQHYYVGSMWVWYNILTYMFHHNGFILVLCMYALKNVTTGECIVEHAGGSFISCPRTNELRKCGGHMFHLPTISLSSLSTHTHTHT